MASRRTLQQGIALVLVVAAIAAGCSSSDDSDGGAAARPTDVPGVTDTAIKVGIMTADPSRNLEAAQTLSGADLGKSESAGQELTWRAIVDLVNSSGGIAGRQIEPVFYFSDLKGALTPSGRQQDQQAACAFFTEDEKVFAVLGEQQASEQLWFDCVRKTGTVFIANTPGNNPNPSADQLADLADLWYQPAGILPARRDAALVPFLEQAGFFADDAKVAVMVEGSPGGKDGFEHGTKPALEAAGLELTTEIVYPDSIESPWETYVLQLQQQGVTHVLWSSGSGSWQPPFNLMQAAEAQGYHPKWGIGSEQCGLCLASLGTPTGQLANVSGMGFLPYIDVADVKPQSDAGAECATALTAAGDKNATTGIECEMAFFLRAALDGSEEVSPAAVADGVAKLGTSYEGAYAIGGSTTFGPDRHDGATVARLFTYEPDCATAPSCFTYSGAPYTLPE